MKSNAVYRWSRRVAGMFAADPLRANVVNNPAYRSTPVDPVSGRRSVMGTGRKDACAVLRASPLAPGEPRTLVVLGVARGGTSMVAGVLRALGVDMGDDLGFNHEDTGIQDIIGQRAYERLPTLVRERNGRHGIWGFKFPEASLVMDRLHPHLRHPHYLFVIRNPMARGMSVSSRTGGKLADAIADALVENKTILDFLDGVPAPAMLINYERATEDGEECVRQVAEFIGIEPDESLISQAVSMILGDGEGYLNLPEFWFHATEASPGTTKLPEALEVEPSSLEEGEIAYARNRASAWKASGSAFPTIFQVSLSLSGAASGTGERLRLYYDYEGRFHIGHRMLIEVASGTPNLCIETTGRLKRLAIVPMGKTVRVSGARFYTTPEAD